MESSASTTAASEIGSRAGMPSSEMADLIAAHLPLLFGAPEFASALEDFYSEAAKILGFDVVVQHNFWPGKALATHFVSIGIPDHDKATALDLTADFPLVTDIAPSRPDSLTGRVTDGTAHSRFAKAFGLNTFFDFRLRANDDSLAGFTWFGKRTSEPLTPQTLAGLRFIKDLLQTVMLQRSEVERLGKREEELRALVNQAAETFWVTDRSGVAVEDSPSWRAYTGQSMSQLAGNGWLDAIHVDDRGAVESAWREAIDRGVGFSIEYRIRIADGSWRWTTIKVAPVKDSSGQVVKWVGGNFDISARKAVEASLFEAGEQKTHFLGVLAHELRNPLAPIRSGIDLLKSEMVENGLASRTLAMMDKQLQHTVRLVDDLLDASRMETGALQVIRQTVALRTILEASVQSIEPAVSAKTQYLETNFADVDVLVEADAVRLTQVFVNILNNSSRYTPHHGTISMEVAADSENVTVVVADNGEGIPETDLPDIFRLFGQAERHRKGNGMGIGLALVQGLVELHGGCVEARNRDNGSGAVFTVRLPVIAASAGRQRADAAVSSEQRTEEWKTQRVLVVDDNEDAAAALGLLMEMHGQVARVVHDGLAAVKEAADFLPQVIFMDLDLGRSSMDGLEATAMIREMNLTPRPLIAALTGRGQDADLVATRESGFDVHIVKPVSLERVLDLLRVQGAAL